MNKKVILWLFFIIICSTIFALSHQPASVSGSLSKSMTTKIIDGSKEIRELSRRKKYKPLAKWIL